MKKSISLLLLLLKELGLEENKDAVRYGHFSAKGTRKRILPIAQTGVTAVVCISDLLACSAVRFSCELVPARHCQLW